MTKGQQDYLPVHGETAVVLPAPAGAVEGDLIPFLTMTMYIAGQWYYDTEYYIFHDTEHNLPAPAAPSSKD